MFRLCQTQKHANDQWCSVRQEGLLMQKFAEAKSDKCNALRSLRGLPATGCSGLPS
jgi:hypothetical protein